MTHRRSIALLPLVAGIALAGCATPSASRTVHSSDDGPRADAQIPPSASGLNTINEVQGEVLNQLPLFGRRDWVSLGCTLFPVSIQRSDARAGGERRSMTVGEGGDATPIVFRFPTDTQFRARFGSESTGSINGTIGLSPVRTDDGSLRALPRSADVVLRVRGQTITLCLDRTSPFNTLEAASDGSGVLSLALTVDSKSDDLAWSLYLGETFLFRLPVTVDPEFRSLRFKLTPSMPGHQYTPVSRAMLDAADGSQP